MSEWRTLRSSEIADVRVSNVDKKSLPHEQVVLLCNYMDVYSNEYITSDLPFMAATAAPNQIERFRVQLGDVMITKDSETPDDIGVPAVAIEDIPNLGCGYHLALIKPDPKQVDGRYLAKQLANKTTANYFGRRAAGSTRYGLSNGTINDTPVPLPPLPQQRRIASILTTLDEEIEATEALIAKHQQIKAGLMHDLFTRGLWTQAELDRGDHCGLPSEASAKAGSLRPSPEDAPGLYQESEIGLVPKAWRSKRLPEVVDFWDGKRIPLKEDDRAEVQGDIPYYGASGIIDWIDRWLFDDELILLGEDGENIISRNLPLAFKVVGKCWVNNHAHVMKPKSGQSIDYWTNYLEWRDYSRMTSGSAQPKITQGHLARMPVAEPPEQEQAAIAIRMDAIHSLLETETTHLAKLRQQKQGLMHDLLTGRVRVEPSRCNCGQNRKLGSSYGFISTTCA